MRTQIQSGSDSANVGIQRPFTTYHPACLQCAHIKICPAAATSHPPLSCPLSLSLYVTEIDKIYYTGHICSRDLQFITSDFVCHLILLWVPPIIKWGITMGFTIQWREKDGGTHFALEWIKYSFVGNKFHSVRTSSWFQLSEDLFNLKTNELQLLIIYYKLGD